MGGGGGLKITKFEFFNENGGVRLYGNHGRLGC